MEFDYINEINELFECRDHFPILLFFFTISSCIKCIIYINQLNFDTLILY